MKVEIGTEEEQLIFWEYINGIFVAVWLSDSLESLCFSYNLNSGKQREKSLFSGMYLLIPISRTWAILLGGEWNILYLNPLPQHLAEGLPAVRQERPDGLVPVYSGTVPVSGVYEKLTVPSCECFMVHNFEVHQDTIRYIKTPRVTVLLSAMFTPSYMSVAWRRWTVTCMINVEKE